MKKLYYLFFIVTSSFTTVYANDLSANVSHTAVNNSVDPPATLVASPSSLLIKAYGTPRTLTVTNVSANTAHGIGYDVRSGGTRMSVMGTCATGSVIDLPPGQSCTLTIVSQGAVPAGSPVVSGTVSVSALNTNIVKETLAILDYGNIYQDGFIYSMNDDPRAANLSAKAVSTQTLQGYWSTYIILAYTFSGSLTDGIYNLTQMKYIDPSLKTYSAEQGCVNYKSDQGYTNWYLPAICDMGESMKEQVAQLVIILKMNYINVV